MTAEEQIEHLTTQLKQALAQLQTMQEELQKAQERIAELEKKKTPPPSFVKANAKKPKGEEKKPRKKRDAQHNHARPRSVPNQIVEHRIVECPDCHLRLGGISLARQREVIDVPPPAQAIVTDHRIFKGWCSGCQKWTRGPGGFYGTSPGTGTPRSATREYDRLFTHRDALAFA